MTDETLFVLKQIKNDINGHENISLFLLWLNFD